MLIVGGGPVGLVLSMELASRGIANLLVNDAETRSRHPKGNSLNCRTMEHLRRLGFADEIRQTGLYPEHPTDVVYVTRFTGHELARLNMPPEKTKRKSRSLGRYTSDSRTDAPIKPILL